MDSHCVHQSGHVAKAGQFGQKRLPDCLTARLPSVQPCAVRTQPRLPERIVVYVHQNTSGIERRALPSTQYSTPQAVAVHTANLAASKIEADSSGGGWLSNSSRGCGYRCLLLTGASVLFEAVQRLYEHQCYQLESFDDLAHKESYSLAGFLQKKRWAWHWPRSNTVVLFAKNHPKTPFFSYHQTKHVLLVLSKTIANFQQN